MTTSQKFSKRLFDVLLSIFGLMVFWPVIGLCVLIARLDTGLSGIFLQRRVGLHGKLITVYKIRTMRDVDSMKENTVTVGGDLRITAVGRIMRRLKFDELPQLWNVLKGDMSLVGPRPDVPGYADNLRGDERDILQLRPGITGPATIKFRNEEFLLSRQANPQQYNDDVVFPQKVNLNLDYLRNWTFYNDIGYILITLKLLPTPAELLLNISEE